MSRSRKWCFTLNNYTDSDWIDMHRFLSGCVYAIMGKEVGESGTPHIQGYGHWKNAVSFNAIKKRLPSAHIDVAHGSDADNQKYCSKDGDFIEIGKPMVEEQGKRNDIHSIALMIRAREISLEDLMFEYPDLYLKYSRSFEKMFNAVLTPRNTLPQVHWRWGKAGVGKTRFVVDNHPSLYSKDNTIWWDGYNQQEAIVIDDFDNTIPYRTLLRILDRYVYQGQIKGGYIQVNSPFIYITCEYPPDRYWDGNELAQVTRRLTSVTEIK